MNKKPNLALLKHYNKALRQVPGSLKQQDTIKQIDILHGALRKEPIKEDGGAMVGGVPANNVGDGAIDGIGIGPRGEPGINKKRKVTPLMGFIRRKLPITK